VVGWRFDLEGRILSNILLELKVSFCPPPTTSFGSKRAIGEERTVQFFEGLSTFFSSVMPICRDHGVDVYILDNTLPGIEHLDKRIRKIIPDDVEVIFNKKNFWGKFNNGAGDIDGWRDQVDRISRYDWFVHHEPRLEIISPYFFDSFLNDNRELFKVSSNNQKSQFWTGTFACKTSSLVTFMESMDLLRMVQDSVSIEYAMYDFFASSSPSFSTIDKIDVVWKDGATGERHVC